MANEEHPADIIARNLDKQAAKYRVAADRVGMSHPQYTMFGTATLVFAGLAEIVRDIKKELPDE
jgi:hypothetical protein